ncbi:YCF48-related protein [Acidocella sp.]|uniref:WD40/YVTN/BNR-like repeat-containing protein n=1 Tax=Acidocella sp. TaxID=50710 RepID=UPI00260E620A|nr:YCF48-related protein [Acidocella sp.]
MMVCIPILRRICAIFVMFACLASAETARASDQLSPMLRPAISVANPSQALLICISRADKRLVAAGEHGLIIYSDDNGQSWQQATVPTSETITAVAFADAQTGWAAGGQGVILHTTDGGVHWDLQLTDDQVLALMTKAAAAFAASHPGDDTADRAQHRANILADAGDDKPFLTIVATTPEDVTVFGAYRFAVHTTDEGKTWEDWSLHVGDPVSHNIYKATPIGSSIYLAGEAGVVLRSDDAGQSYSMVTVPDQNTFLGILGTKQAAIVTYGVAGEIFRSTDRGQSWKQAQSPSASDLTDGIILPSGVILLTSEDGNLFESQDDGQTFNVVGANLRMGVFGVTQAANGDLVFVGSGGVRVEPLSSFATMP